MCSLGCFGSVMNLIGILLIIHFLNRSINKQSHNSHILEGWINIMYVSTTHHINRLNFNFLPNHSLLISLVVSRAWEGTSGEQIAALSLRQ